MADFRKCVPVLAILALILGLTSTANAQALGFTCTANSAVPQQLRFEGLTELVGDIVIQCTGGVPTPPNVVIPQVNITVFMGNTTVTSRIIDTTNSPYTSEALLMLDEPTPAPAASNNNLQVLCSNPLTGCTGYGNGAGGFIPNPNGTGIPYFNGTYYGASVPSGISHPNMYKGLYNPLQPNAVAWVGIPIDPPGTNGTRVIRITNIRINANALGVGTETSPPVQAQAFISATPSTSLPITNNASQVVGYVQRGLRFDLSAGPSSYKQCAGFDCSTAAKYQALSAAATLRYRENFASAFKLRTRSSAGTGIGGVSGYQDLPGVLYGSESGFYSAVTWASSATAGVADFGTRVKAVFKGVPAGVTLYVDSAYYNGVSGAYMTSSESGAYSASVSNYWYGGTPGTGATRVPLTLAVETSGTTYTGTAVWEIGNESQQTFDQLLFNVYVCYTASPGTNSPGLGTATVNGSFAPISTVTTASTSAPIPRFADSSTATNIFSISVCATNLLFPYVVNVGGFDTGLAVANTSVDPFGTTPQAGVCTFYSYGTNAAASFTSGTTPMAGGTTFSFLASDKLPGFAGYVIARCTYQYAHGFAFISDLGARNLAMGYLALIIPETPRSPMDSSVIGGANAGEQLGQ